MRKTPKSTNSSELYRKIDASILTSAEKSQARVALGLADKVAEVVAYFVRLLTPCPSGHA